jgi:anti-anti-sigma factor
MRITESRSSRGITLFVAGSINTATSPQLQNELFRASKINANVSLDFADVVAVDDSGIRVLQAGMRTVASKRGRLTIQNANAAVKNTLHTEGLGRLLMFV